VPKGCVASGVSSLEVPIDDDEVVNPDTNQRQETEKKQAAAAGEKAPNSQDE